VTREGAEKEEGEEEGEMEHTWRARKVKIPLKPVAFREAVSTLSSPAMPRDR